MLRMVRADDIDELNVGAWGGGGGEASSKSELRLTTVHLVQPIRFKRCLTYMPHTL